MEDVSAAFARLTARFSLSDLPDFLVILCRGDLSAMVGPFDVGAYSGPGFSTLRVAWQGGNVAWSGDIVVGQPC